MRWLGMPFRAFWRETEYPFRKVVGDVDRQVAHTRWIIRVFYFIWLVFALQLTWGMPLLEHPEAEPLWPVAWVGAVPWAAAVYGLAFAFVLGPFAAFLLPDQRWTRLFAFVGILEYLALFYSYGKIGHGYHLLLLAAGVLVLMPRLRADATEAQKRAYLEVFWGAQLVILATYTVAGLQKFWGISLDWQEREMTALHPYSLAMHAARNFLATDREGPLGWVLLDYPAAGYPLMLATLYLETLAVFAVFRPSQHRLFGLAIVGMHTGIALTMDIWFTGSMLALTLFLIASPFSPRRFHLRRSIRELPWLGPLFSATAAKWARLRGRSPEEEIIVFYDGDCGLCDRFVSFCLKHGVPDGVHFAKQQGERFAALKFEHPYLNHVDTVVVYTRRGEDQAIRVRSDAMIWMISQFHGPLSWGFVLLLVPLPLLNLGYRAIAATRKRLFPKSDATCPVPTPEQKALFLD